MEQTVLKNIGSLWKQKFKLESNISKEDWHSSKQINALFALFNLFDGNR
jgi:hypothetical protein